MEKMKFGIDVIVRFHDLSRVDELDRAIFSLIVQKFRPLSIFVCVQRFSSEEVDIVKRRLAPLLSIEGAPTLQIHNFELERPTDARSSLLNLGISVSRSRFLAFLDYDDVLYPEAYVLLVRRLLISKSAVVFGGIQLTMVDKYPAFDFVTGKSLPFTGRNLVDLMVKNFCPIHSFVIDREQVAPDLLYFDPTLNRNEDYDFLLRLTSEVTSDFALVRNIIGEYYLKNDGSNTILTESASTPRAILEWERAEKFMEARRSVTKISPLVQKSLGLDEPIHDLTIQGLLDAAHLIVS